MQSDLTKERRWIMSKKLVKNKPKQKKVIGYLRVSTMSQDLEKTKLIS
jgi:hypothetical protein